MPKKKYYKNVKDMKTCELCEYIFMPGDNYLVINYYKKKWKFLKVKHRIEACYDCYLERICIYCKMIKKNNVCQECKNV